MNKWYFRDKKKQKETKISNYKDKQLQRDKDKQLQRQAVTKRQRQAEANIYGDETSLTA